MLIVRDGNQRMALKIDTLFFQPALYYNMSEYVSMSRQQVTKHFYMLLVIK